MKIILFIIFLSLNNSYSFEELEIKFDPHECPVKQRLYACEFSLVKLREMCNIEDLKHEVNLVFGINNCLFKDSTSKLHCTISTDRFNNFCSFIKDYMKIEEDISTHLAFFKKN